MAYQYSDSDSLVDVFDSQIAEKRFLIFAALQAGFQIREGVFRIEIVLIIGKQEADFVEIFPIQFSPEDHVQKNGAHSRLIGFI